MVNPTQVELEIEDTAAINDDGSRVVAPMNLDEANLDQLVRFLLQKRD